MTKQPGKTAGEVLLEAATQSRTSIVLALRTAALWGLSVFLWLVCLSVGWSTLVGQGAMATAFGQTGVGLWARFAAGAVELASAIVLLIPRARLWGAIGIAVVMTGMTMANISILHAPPLAMMTGALAIAAVLLMILAWSEARARRH